MARTWEDVLGAIAEKVPQPTFERWFRPLTAEKFTSGEVTLVADDEFDALFIEKNFAQLIRLHLERITGDAVSLHIIHHQRPLTPTPPVPASTPAPAAPGVARSSHSPSSSEPSGHTPSAPVNAAPAPRTEPPRIEAPRRSLAERATAAGLRLQYDFDQFVVGPSNEFALAACHAVKDRPGAVYNPLFLTGSVGLGKTHLINAIGIEMLRRDPNCRVHYCSSESFMNDLIEHLRTGQMVEFRDRFRGGIDALLIDDVQFLSGKVKTQLEFFHTFNALHQSRAQIVLTCDRFPHEIPDLDERLRSRFQWGLVADIQPPGLDTRRAILRAKADNLGLDLSPEVELFLAENVTANVRELEGALLRLHAFVGFNDTLLTVDLARDLLRKMLVGRDRQVTAEAVQKLVASYYNVRVADLKGRSRHRAIAQPRQIAMYLAKKLGELSYPQVGKAFGGRDHTTALAAYRKVESLLDSDPTLAAAISHLIDRLLQS
jgi:chromosomal replication initiator protein